MNTRAQLLSALFLAIILGGLVFFIRQPETPSVAMARPAEPPKIQPSAAVVSKSSSDEPRHYRPPPVTAAVRRKVDDFIRRYKDMSTEELMKNEEVSAMLEGFMEGLNTPEFERKMEERVAAIQAAKGVKHGTLQIITGKLDDPEGRAWLEALFSEDTQRMEDYLMNKLDGAIFELAFDPTLEQTNSGVTVRGSDAPAPAANKLPD